MEEFYTVNQAAIILKVHSLTIRRYLKEGKLRAYRVGGNVRISLGDIKSFTQGFVSQPKSAKNSTFNNSSPFSLADPLFRLKGRGISLSRSEQE